MISRCRSLGRTSRTTGSTVLAVALLLVGTWAGTAQARTEILRWTHSRSDEVVRWEAHIGASPGSYSEIVELQNPSQDGSGVFQSSVEVPDDAVVYIALRAFGPADEASPLSNIRERRPESADGSGGETGGEAGGEAGGETGGEAGGETGGETGGGSTGGGDAGGSGPEETDLGGGSTIPEATNAVHREDFSGAPISTSVSGWVDTGANFTTDRDDALFEVVSLDGNRVLATNSSLYNTHSHLVAGTGSWSNLTLSGRMATDSSSAGVGVTAYSGYPNSSSYPSSLGYYRLARERGGSFEIEGMAGLTCDNADTNVTPDPNTWYVFEFSVQSEPTLNRIQAKVWRQGDPEPDAPQAECVDRSSARPTSGSVGVWSSRAGQKYWDDLEVRTVATGTSEPLTPPILLQIVPVEY